MNASELWNAEYLKIKGLPTSSQDKKKGGHAVHFLNYLQSNHIYGGNFLDIGCGLGNDAVFFANNGFKTRGFDISEIAITKAREMVINEHHKNIDFLIQDVRNKWNFPQNSFNVAYDGTTFINLTNDAEVRNYFNELKRVLTNGGLYQIVLPVLPDEYYAKLINESQSRIVVNNSGIMQRVYEKDEMIGLIEKHLSIEKIEVVKKKNKMYDVLYKRNMLRVVAKNEKS